MKNFRILMTAAAFILALGAATATALHPLTSEYIIISIPAPGCQQVSPACGGGAAVCTDSSSNTVYDSPNLVMGTCGNFLHHI